MQLLHNVVTGKAVGGGRKGYYRNVGEALLDKGECGVVGPEVVAPLRNAVGLVDSHEADVETTPVVEVLKQAFGRYVE